MENKVSLGDLEKKVNSRTTNLIPSDVDPEEQAKALSVTYDDMVKNYLPEKSLEKIRNLNAEAKKKFVQEVIDYSNKSRYRIGKKCDPERCYTKTECPLWNIDPSAVPAGHRCPFELVEIDKIYTKYHDLFVNDLRIDKGIVDLYLKELIVLEINIERVNEAIADRGLLEQSPIFGFPKSERIIEGQISSPLFDILEKLLRRRDTFYKALLITSESRARYKMNAESDLQKLVDELKKRGKEAIRRYEQENDGKQPEIAEVIEQEEKEEHASG